ncbi:MAG: cupin domain-containing protein [Thermoplasmata archaeon]|nr:cupin domain-containing protein [Thermoplasmata archaeon]
MGEGALFIPKGKAIGETTIEGKKIKMLFKSEKMEGLLIEVEPGDEFGKTYTHDGEEIHLVIEGEIEYLIGEDAYPLKEGDALWHKATIPHSARNPGTKKAVYLTIGAPPTFM